MRTELHDRAALPWQLIAGVVLAGLLVTLATFQYRWLGEVGEAERERMRTGLQTRVADFTQAFDRELTQIYVSFHGEPDLFGADAAPAIAKGLARAQASATVPGLIKEVFLLEVQGPRANLLQRLDPNGGVLRPTDWPPALERWRSRALHAGAAGGFPIVMADAVDAAAPALIVPLPFVKKVDNGDGHIAVLSDPAGPARALIVWLDADRLRRQLLEPLVERYFGSGDASAYLVSIVARDDPARSVYASKSGVPIDARTADATAGMFDLRMNELARVAPPGASALSGSAVVKDRVAITIVRRSTASADAGGVLMSGGSQGAWEVRARYRSGSLESIVARSRRWNLAIGLGVLGLLGAAFALVIVGWQRQQRLVRQQMEFVAAVSHELRTPLAVICSAGENLADGVVADAGQVKRYGSLIETEGRRLGDMVERVLLFAGIGSGAQTRARAEVDVAQVIADAVDGVGADARDRGVSVGVRTASPLPPVAGDADALRSAVQNLVGNAVKYSHSGGSVEVTADLVDGVVRIRVVDRGIGIDAADLPDIFKPFYRGRRAVDAQVRGTGVGLSVVLHVVRAHGGDVQVESRVDAGTAVTVVLPAMTASDRPEGAGRVVRLKGERGTAAS